MQSLPHDTSAIIGQLSSHESASLIQKDRTESGSRQVATLVPSAIIGQLSSDEFAGSGKSYWEQ